MKRGELWWADLVLRSGSEQKGRRPVLILSHDGFNQAPGWRSIIVLPISTSKAQAKRGPTVVMLAKGEGGLKSASVALCHQITTLHRVKLTRCIGTLAEQALVQVEEGVKAALDLE